MKSLVLLAALLAPQEPEPTPATPQPATAIAWQRTLEDALAVSKATGRPLLICVNMDGEVFCERFAAQTYKDPEFVALTRGYVPLIVSPDRHNEMDYDHRGHRVPCPRFGTVTCSEHIFIEPKLYERYFDGKRNAPRHVGVGLDGRVLFDRLMDRSMRLAIDAIAENRVAGTDLPALTDSIKDLLARRDATARERIEARYKAGSKAARENILDAARKSTSAPIDLLRMALLESDPQLYAAAVRALSATATVEHRVDLEDALAKAEGDDLRGDVWRALRRLAKDDEDTARAVARLEAVNRGLEAAAREPWKSAMRQPAATVDPIDPRELDRQLDELTTKLKAEPRDGAVLLTLAEAWLEFAQQRIDQGKDPTFVLEDARRTAQRALDNGALAGSALAIEAWASWLLTEPTAGEVAGRAVEALGKGPADHAATRAAARALEVQGKSAIATTYQAVTDDPDAVPGELITAACLGYEVLTRHPWATEQHVQDYTGFLQFLGARRAERAVLATAALRFPASGRLHEQLRNRVLIDLGAGGLRPLYRELLAKSDDVASTAWFAGYAAIVEAEMRLGQKHKDAASQAYDECIDLFRASADSNRRYADSANHFAVLALAGRARLAFDAGDNDRAVNLLCTATELRPGSLGEMDGLQRRPIAILRAVHRGLKEAGDEERATRLRSAVETNAPALLGELK